MKWISEYQLFLFDFDGLLVNTEQLHFQAYKNMCANRGFNLKWDFQRYSQAAHHTPTDLRDQIYIEFPQLKLQEPNWSVLYQEKKQAFIQLIQDGEIELMPGVTNLIKALDQAQIPSCVVTHSSKVLVDLICAQQKVLNLLTHFITREDYIEAKPHPECYQIAIERYAKKGDRIIGFEDSPRGVKALLGTEATPVLVCEKNYAYVNKLLSEHSLSHYTTFDAITDEQPPLNNQHV